MSVTRGLLRVAVAALAALSVAGCWGESAFTVTNRTTTPVVVVDWKSVSVVAACSERTIGWHGTWGGGADYKPIAEPVPSGAWTMPADDVPLGPMEGSIVRQVVVTSAGVSENGDRNAPCDGPPPPSPPATVSPIGSTPATGGSQSPSPSP